MEGLQCLSLVLSPALSHWEAMSFPSGYCSVTHKDHNSIWSIRVCFYSTIIPYSFILPQHWVQRSLLWVICNARWDALIVYLYFSIILAFSLDFFTDVLDLSYLLEMFEKDPVMKRYHKLNKAITDVVQDYGLVSFSTLCIEVGTVNMSNNMQTGFQNHVDIGTVC